MEVTSQNKCAGNQSHANEGVSGASVYALSGVGGYMKSITIPVIRVGTLIRQKKRRLKSSRTPALKRANAHSTFKIKGCMDEPPIIFLELTHPDWQPAMQTPRSSLHFALNRPRRLCHIHPCSYGGCVRSTQWDPE